jgi:hypothetical protein
MGPLTISLPDLYDAELDMRATVIGGFDCEYDIAGASRTAAQLLDEIAASPPDGAHAIDGKREVTPFRAKRAYVEQDCALHAEHRLWIPLAKRLKPRDPLRKLDGQVVWRHPGVDSVATLAAPTKPMPKKKSLT